MNQHKYSDNCTCDQCSQTWRGVFMQAVDRGEKLLKEKYINWMNEINDNYSKQYRSIFIEWLKTKGNRFDDGNLIYYFKYVQDNYIKLNYPKYLLYIIDIHINMIHHTALYIYNKIIDIDKDQNNESNGIWRILTQMSSDYILNKIGGKKEKPEG